MSLVIAKNNTGFNLVPQDMGQAMQLATMMANSQLVPQHYKGKPEDTLIAMMMGSELGLNAMQSIQNIAVINGRPAIWGDALLALVQNHPRFGGIEETFDESTMTATCTVWRKGGTKHTQTFNQRDAELAGLWGRNTWKQYPKRMLSMRARGFALRNQFADALLGLITAEEAQDYPTDTGAVSNQPTEQKRIEQLPEYPADKFSEHFGMHTKMIADGKKSADDLIAMISTKYTLTDEQQKAYIEFELDHKASQE